MASRRGKHEEHENVERWLLTYADMITLLMAFFIMLYSMSQLDLKKFDAMTGSVQAQLGGTGLLKGAMNPKPGPEKGGSLPGIAPQLGGGPAALKKVIEKELAPLVSGLKVAQYGDEVRVTLPATILNFPAGSAEPTPAMRTALQTLAGILAPGRYAIRVTGHTCNLPVHNERYQSNWELSADRARNVAFLLIRYKAVKPNNITYMGLADTQPLYPNDSEAHRARNRRVEIRIRPLALAGTTLRHEAEEALWKVMGSSSPAVAPRKEQPIDIHPHLEQAIGR